FDVGDRPVPKSRVDEPLKRRAALAYGAQPFGLLFAIKMHIGDGAQRVGGCALRFGFGGLCLLARINATRSLLAYCSAPFARARYSKPWFFVRYLDLFTMNADMLDPTIVAAR